MSMSDQDSTSVTRADVEAKLIAYRAGLLPRGVIANWARSWLYRHPIPDMDLVVRLILVDLCWADHWNKEDQCYPFGPELIDQLLNELQSEPERPAPSSIRRGRALSDLSTEEIQREAEYLQRQDVRTATTDISKLGKGRKGRFLWLAPDVELFRMATMRPLRDADRIHEWKRERVVEEKHFLSRTFYVEFPVYRLLKNRITPVNAPHLYADLDLYEEARQVMLELVNRVYPEDHS